MKNFKFLGFLLLIVLLTLLFSNNSEYNNTPQEAINKFQHALEKGSADELVKNYCNNLLDEPRIITNVPTIYKDKVWPWHENIDNNIPVGNVITGIDELKKYQENVFKAFTFHNLTSKIISIDIYQDNAVAIIYGTHVIKGIKGTKFEGQTKYTQAQEMWHIKRCEQKGWCIQNIAFIDKVRT